MWDGNPGGTRTSFPPRMHPHVDRNVSGGLAGIPFRTKQYGTLGLSRVNEKLVLFVCRANCPCPLSGNAHSSYSPNWLPPVHVNVADVPLEPITTVKPVGAPTVVYRAVEVPGLGVVRALVPRPPMSPATSAMTARTTTPPPIKSGTRHRRAGLPPGPSVLDGRCRMTVGMSSSSDEIPACVPSKGNASSIREPDSRASRGSGSTSWVEADLTYGNPEPVRETVSTSVSSTDDRGPAMGTGGAGGP